MSRAISSRPRLTIAGSGRNDHGHELAVAVDSARRAGRLQMERYERLERIVHKSEHDVVTEVDELSEQLIIGALRDAFPTDSFLAEESGHQLASGLAGESAVDLARVPAEQGGVYLQRERYLSIEGFLPA